MTGAASGAHEKLSFSTVNITEGGYLYVFVSNESNTDFEVYFDDLRITHTKGKVIQEDHYYPFGLNISALSSTAPLSKPNQFKFNDIELTDDFHLDWYEAFYRGYDPSLGRWMQVDPESEQFADLSPYNFGFNDPGFWSDPFGNCPKCPKDGTDGQEFTTDDGPGTYLKGMIGSGKEGMLGKLW